METLRRFPPQFQKEVFKKLESIVDIASLTKEERIKYDESIKVYRDNLAVVACAEEKGRIEGSAEGRAEGREEGLAEGMEKGALKKQLEMARKMKSRGYLLEVISELTVFPQQKSKSYKAEDRGKKRWGNRLKF